MVCSPTARCACCLFRPTARARVHPRPGFLHEVARHHVLERLAQPRCCASGIPPASENGGAGRLGVPGRTFELGATASLGRAEDDDAFSRTGRGGAVAQNTTFVVHWLTFVCMKLFVPTVDSIAERVRTGAGRGSRSVRTSSGMRAVPDRGRSTRTRTARGRPRDEPPSRARPSPRSDRLILRSPEMSPSSAIVPDPGAGVDDGPGGKVEPVLGTLAGCAPQDSSARIRSTGDQPWGGAPDAVCSRVV